MANTAGQKSREALLAFLNNKRKTCLSLHTKRNIVMVVTLFPKVLLNFDALKFLEIVTNIISFCMYESNIYKNFGWTDSLSAQQDITSKKLQMFGDICIWELVF